MDFIAQFTKSEIFSLRFTDDIVHVLHVSEMISSHLFIIITKNIINLSSESLLNFGMMKQSMHDDAEGGGGGVETI